MAKRPEEPAPDPARAEPPDRAEALEQANIALRLAEQRLRQVIDLVPHFVFAKDLDGRFLLVNQAVAEAYGTTVEALRGKTDADFASSEEEVRSFRRDDLEVIRSGRPKVIADEVITDAQGRVRHLHTTKIPFTYSGTQTPALLGVAIDVTEQKRLEAQLLQAQKMEGLGRLAGGIAHDFNNLLTVIVGYAQMLEDARLPGEARQHAERIHDAALRAGTLTQQLLTFARGQVSDRRVLDVNSLVLSISHLFKRLLGEDIALATELDPDLGRVEADASQLEQVLMNLAVNARDAMPKGGRLTVATRSRTEGEAQRLGGALAPAGACVEIAVADTGIGMDAATMAHIFEPFFTTKTGGRGTGLGLATSYGIVKRFGGHIWAESAPDKGTTLHILLPRTEKPLAQATTGAPSESGGRGETILLAEDNAAVRDVTVASLRQHGYEVIAAEGMQDALTRARRHPGTIHLLVTDVVMADGDGPQLAKALLEEHPDTRVLYVSGYSPEALHGANGPTDHPLLAKPFTPLDLARKVRSILDA
jgi:PAS domain S-box-containing protein